MWIALCLIVLAIAIIPLFISYEERRKREHTAQILQADVVMGADGRPAIVVAAGADALRFARIEAVDGEPGRYGESECHPREVQLPHPSDISAEVLRMVAPLVRIRCRLRTIGGALIQREKQLAGPPLAEAQDLKRRIEAEIAQLDARLLAAQDNYECERCASAIDLPVLIAQSQALIEAWEYFEQAGSSRLFEK